MFDSIGWAEFLVLGVAGLFILGPERLPAAASWAAGALRKVREYTSAAREQLETDLGPALGELREPLEDLRRLRGADPRRAVARHLLGPDEHRPVTAPPAEPGTPTTVADDLPGDAGTSLPGGTR